MANKRMIASDIWRDDFVCTLDYFKRLLWIGMVVTCADDQGRIQDRAGFIASDVFPGEMLSFESIENVLKEFEEQGKIIRYAAGKVRLIQISNWWNYQSPSWAMASKYPGPEGWVDRVKMHVKDNKIVSYNWDKPGGFQHSEPVQDNQLHTPLPTMLHNQLHGVLPSGIEESRVEDGEGDGDGEDDVDVPAAIAPGDINNPVSRLLVQFELVSGLKMPILQDKVVKKWYEFLIRMDGDGVTEEIVRRACLELTEKHYHIAGPWSIEKACGMILAERKRETVPRERQRDSAGAYADFINH